ncbi:3'-5' exonuclease [Candidatus Micrarchaeota archaeon]|nr:3'-5' exonuclease [Candidatus Micrarchaeota archaeon]
MPIVVLDVETTGLGHKAYQPRPDAVVQIGMAWREPKGTGAVKTWSKYCHPGEQYLKGGRAQTALDINGITKEILQAAQPASFVAEQFWQQVFRIESSGDAVQFRAYNKAFDAPFLAAEPWNVPENRWGDCIMLDAQSHLQSYKWPKLDAAVRSMGLLWPEGNAHDAAVDAHAALLVHEKITGHATPVNALTE